MGSVLIAVLAFDRFQIGLFILYPGVCFLEGQHGFKLLVFKYEQVFFQGGYIVLKVLELFRIMDPPPVQGRFALFDFQLLGFNLVFGLFQSLPGFGLLLLGVA